MSDDALRRAILDLGLEDNIPLWEVTDTCRAANLIGPGSAGVQMLAGTLLDLARGDEIRISVGRWDAPEPRYVELAEAEALLADSRRYTSDVEIAEGLERVYYVNVENIVE